mgnify:CR=1 FL=1
MNLTMDQQNAADQFLKFMLDDSQGELIISGFAGVGKSTLTEHILATVDNQLKMLSVIMGLDDESMETYVTATTNKAAQVIAQMAGTTPQTIHSLLGLRVVNDYRTGDTKLEKTGDHRIFHKCLIIIDEASFVDSRLLGFIKSSTNKCKVVYIGDPYQLAPTFEKNPPVFEMDVPETRLTEVIRNEGNIQLLSAQFRNSVETGEFAPIVTGGNVEHVDGPTFQRMVNQEFTVVGREDNSAKILAWSNARVHQYNGYVRELNGLGAVLEVGERVITNKPVITKSGGLHTDAHATVTSVDEQTLRYNIPGRYVKLNGHYSIFCPDNQDLVKRSLRQYAKDKDWSTYFDIKENFADLRPLHACTVHKSQGSTYRTVFMDLSDIGRCNVPSDLARMMYVGLSRAADKVVLYGDLPAKYGGIQCQKLAS